MKSFASFQRRLGACAVARKELARHERKTLFGHLWAGTSLGTELPRPWAVDLDGMVAMLRPSRSKSLNGLGVDHQDSLLRETRRLPVGTK